LSGAGRAALLSAALAAGCGAGPPERTVVDLWAMGREGEVVEEMIPDFERVRPDVHVRVQQIPWSAAHEKLLTAFVGDAMPDVFQAGNTWLPELVALGALEPLDARLDASAAVARTDYFPGVLDTNVIAGTTWGVPWYVDTRVLFYRPDLLAEAGHPEPPRTRAAWLEAMAAVRARAGPDRWAILLPVREWQPLVIFALQNGAGLLRDGDRFGDFRAPEFRAALELWAGLFRRGLAPPSGETSVANVYQDFARGWVAFWMTGPWNLGELARRLPAGTPWATAPLPAPEGAPWPGVSLAGGASLVLSRRSARKEAAWALVEWLSAPARQARFHQRSGDLPARRSAWADAGLEHTASARAFGIQLQHTLSTPKIPEWERIAAKVSQWAEAAVRGDMTDDEALAALDRDVDQVLAKRRWLLERGAGR
jgi:multiple sugar transport system substrate-binding protein